MNRYINRLLKLCSDGFSHFLKDNLVQTDGIEALKSTSEMITPTSTHGAGSAGGTRAGLFRTPISGGVQSATSVHDLPRPALAVRNLMEQVNRSSFSQVFYVLK